MENVQELKDIVLPEDRSVVVHNFRAPDRVMHVSTKLSGRVKLLTQKSHAAAPDYVEVLDKVTHEFNTSLTSTSIHDLFLALNGGGEYTLRTLGNLKSFLL